MRSPILSLIIPAKSLEDPQLKDFLKSVKNQSMNPEEYEVIVETEGNAEQAKGYAIRKAKGEILGFFCTDNYLKDRNFLSTMTYYARLPETVGSYTTHFDYVPYDKPLSRYFALLGANDPVCFWLRKADRFSYLRHPKTQLVRIGNRIPTIGDNGCFIKREYVSKVFNLKEDFFFLNMVHDLWNRGYKSYYIVSEKRLWHKTGESWKTYLTKRFKYADKFYFKDYDKRRWKMVQGWRDWVLVVGFVLSSLIVIPNLIYSVILFAKTKDWASFLHPVISLGLTLIYGVLWIKFLWHRLLSSPQEKKN